MFAAAEMGTLREPRQDPVLLELLVVGLALGGTVVDDVDLGFAALRRPECGVDPGMLELEDGAVDLVALSGLTDEPFEGLQ
jgi:hypothetical protein